MSRNGLPNSNPHFPDTALGSFFVDYLWDTIMHTSKIEKLEFAGTSPSPY